MVEHLLACTKKALSLTFSTMLETNQTIKQIGKTDIVIYSCNLSVLGAIAGELL